MITTWWGLGLLAVATAAVAMVVTALVARAVGRASVVDVTWGLAFVAIGLGCAVFGSGTPWRRWLVCGLVAVWGLRLAWHILSRQHGSGEDPRYEKLLDGGGFGVAVRKVFLTQAVVICVIALPLVASGHASVVSPLGPWLVGLGIVVWLVGFCFETVGDAQLAAYKRDPDRPPILDRGLWAWTRHPNYFGDACVWWGLWLAGGAASGWLAALVALPAPLAMTYFVRNVSGAKLLERTMSSRPGWDAYAARVPLFVPRPPRGS